MQRKCLKCEHVHTNATGDELESCPQCGAIYTRVEVARAKAQLPAQRVRAAKEGELQHKKMLQEFWLLLALLGVMATVWVYFKVSGSSVPQPQVRSQVEAPVVSNRAWDGSVQQVERYLKANLKNPGSLEVLEWGQVVASANGFLVRVKYRAKNSFGAYSVEQKVFHLDASGAVASSRDL